MKIIITGSLGHIGKPLAIILVKKGHQVTVISSKPEKRQEIEDLGAAAAIGSLEDADFLATTFSGADALFAMVPPNYAEPDVRIYYQRLASNYVRAIEQAGVKHLVHLSSYGADLDQGTGFILGAHDAESTLNKLSALPVTHLRPGYFYYNLNNFVEMIKEAGLIGSNYGGEDRIILVDPADIAAAAAEELETPVPVGKVRYVASDEWTAGEIAQVLGTAIGKPDLKWLTLTDEQTRVAMESKGMPPPIVANFVELGAAIHSGILYEDYDRHQPAALGKIKLEDFAREFAAAFEE